MEFTANSHHVEHTITDADCQTCHAEVYDTSNHQDASVDLLDPDSGTTSSVTRIEDDRTNLTASDITALTTFCQNCHDDDGAARLGASADDPFGDGESVLAVGTHSNQDFSGAEANFSVDCIQCHTSHGSSNLAIVDSAIVITPGTTVGPVTFTAETGTNSRDDGSGDGICVICHSDSNNAGYPMTNHSGGLHTGWAGDQRGADCSTCHPHEPDSDITSGNGHMPADTNAVGLRGMLAQSGLWPILGLMGVLCAVVIGLRRHH
ncbi:MAG: hypothetical protein JXR84_05390 [Anaerolineae bacterium]|nr:hypothetical protein [Anaerolineae bacterium]